MSNLSVLGPRSGDTEDRRTSVRMRTAWLNLDGLETLSALTRLRGGMAYVDV